MAVGGPSGLLLWKAGACLASSLQLQAAELLSCGLFSAEVVRGLPAALAVTSVDEARSGKHRCCLHPHRQRPLWVGLEALEVGTSEKEGSADMASDLCC